MKKKLLIMASLIFSSSVFSNGAIGDDPCKLFSENPRIFFAGSLFSTVKSKTYPVSILILTKNLSDISVRILNSGDTNLFLQGSCSLGYLQVKSGNDKLAGYIHLLGKSISLDGIYYSDYISVNATMSS